MEIADIGTDIVAVPRMQVFLDRPSLMEKAFDPWERDYALGHKDPLPYLAARFAVKESIIKILRKVTIMEARNIIVGEQGRVRLEGEAARVMEEMGIQRFFVSISHEKDCALAFVIGVRS